MNQRFDQMRHPEQSLAEKMRTKVNVLTLVAAAAGLATELAPEQAQAQVVERQTVRREVPVEELISTQVSAMQNLRQMTAPENAVTRTRRLDYQAEIVASFDSSPLLPGSGPSVQSGQRNLIPNDPVRWLQQGTFYVTLQSGTETLAVRPSTVGGSEFAPSVAPETRTDEPLRIQGLTRTVVSAFQMDSLNSDCSAASRRLENNGHFSAQGTGTTADEAVMSGVRHLVMEHGTGHATTQNLISGDFRSGMSQVLRLERTTAEAGLSHTHVEVNRGPDGLFHAAVSADISVVLVFDPAGH